MQHITHKQVFQREKKGYFVSTRPPTEYLIIYKQDRFKAIQKIYTFEKGH